MNDPLNAFRLDGKVAIITGASSGIGAQTVKLFSSLGAKVIAAARREERLRDLSNQYANVMAVKCDVGIDEDCINLVDTVINEHGKIDILINNAGISDPVPALEEDLDQFKRVIQIDLISCFHLCLLYTSPSPRDATLSRMPSSA